MLCPNCSEQLTVMNVSNQTVLHCKHCGGNFFEENGINRITPDDSQTLTQDAQNNLVTGSPKVCPRDSILMRVIENSEAIPKNVMLFKCPKCNGIFAYPDDLLKFKNAQAVKIQFFKIWQNPLPALRTVLVFSFIAVLSFTVFSNLTNRSLQSTKAESLVSSVLFSHQGRYVFVNFRTTTPFISSILIHDRTANTTAITPINQRPKTLHYTTVTANTQHELFYQIILSDGHGYETKTEEAALVIQP